MGVGGIGKAFIQSFDAQMQAQGAMKSRAATASSVSSRDVKASESKMTAAASWAGSVAGTIISTVMRTVGDSEKMKVTALQNEIRSILTSDKGDTISPMSYWASKSSSHKDRGASLVDYREMQAIMKMTEETQNSAELEKLKNALKGYNEMCKQLGPVVQDEGYLNIFQQTKANMPEIRGHEIEFLQKMTHAGFDYIAKQQGSR